MTPFETDTCILLFILVLVAAGYVAEWIERGRARRKALRELASRVRDWKGGRS